MTYPAGWPLLPPLRRPIPKKIRRIIYRGGYVGLHLFVQELEDRGMRAQWQPPDSSWSGGLCPGTRQHIVEILADGTPTDIGMAIEALRRRDPRAKVEVQETDGGED